MSDDHKEGSVSAHETPKVLTPKELLEKRNQYLTQVKATRGPGHQADLHSRRPSHNATGHTHRTHKPQGG